MQALRSYSNLVVGELEAHLGNYSRVRVLVSSAVGTWLLLKIYGLYEDGDCT